MNTIDSDLRRIFSKFGEVLSAEVVKNKFNGRSKGTAFIDMPVAKEARHAIITLDHTEVDGKIISVNEVRFG